jgi:predicted acetyltransferase
MAFEVKTCVSADELRAAFTPMSQYLGFTPTDEFVERTTRILPPERVVYARADGAVVGGAAAYPFQLTVAGGSVAASGVSFVAVQPTHRRRGILSAMMGEVLAACRGRGEPVAYLWASEDTIYGRFGYGLAGQMGEIEIARDNTQFHPEAAAVAPPGDIHIVPLTEAESLVAPVYESVARTTPGMFMRTPAWWQTRPLVDHEWLRRGGGPLQCAVLQAADGPAAYALYRINMFFERGINNGNLTVIEAAGRTPEATRAIWRYLLDIDWLPRVRAGRLPLDHPLHLLLMEPRRLNFTVRDGVWVRLVDVGAALAARSYRSAEPVVIEVADPFCPWNAGRWQIAPAGARRTDAQADLACDVTALGSAYLGGFTWARLAAALRIQELRPGGIGRADALFRTSSAPWCAEIF